MLKNYYYKCNCGSEVLNIELETDRINDENMVVYLNLSIWLMGHNNHKSSLYEKLRHCYQILRTGKNYADEIILPWEQVIQLSKDLCNIVNSYEEIL